MRVLILLSLFTAVATAFTIPIKKVATATTTTTALNLKRRDLLITGVMGLVVQPLVAGAKGSTFFYDQQENQPVEQSQMFTDGKFDLNAAFVGEYQALRGMFPTAAGKIASHGPYESVKDIYKIEGLTDNDIALFKKYEKFFTVNPPGRGFYERINARVSQ